MQALGSGENSANSAGFELTTRCSSPLGMQPGAAEPGESSPSPSHLEWADATERPSSPEDWAAQWQKAFDSEMLEHVANKYIFVVCMF